MTQSFLEDSFANFNFDSPEQSLLSNTVVDDMNNEIVITEAMIQQACASLDHDSETGFSTNPSAAK
jgi:hypothetical protein